MSIHRAKVTWYEIEQHPPPHGITLMVTGPAFMRNTKNYLCLAYIDEEYRPSHGGPLRWIDIYNDAVTDKHAQPTHWAFPVLFPE